MKKLLIYSFVFFSGSFLFAQESDSLSVPSDPIRYSRVFGSVYGNLLGFSNMGTYVVYPSVRLGYDSYLMQYRYIETAEHFFDWSYNGPYPLLSAEENALLLGHRLILSKSTIGRPFSLDLYAGVGKINGVRRGRKLLPEERSSEWGADHERITYSAYGVALESHLTFPISRIFSVGINAYGNLNNQQSIGGLTMGFHLGWLY